MSKQFDIGVDIGGTFTDCVVVDSESGTSYTAKAPSTPPNFGQGFLDSITEGARVVGTDLSDLLSRTGVVFHGSTVATNALVTRTGAKVGLLTTKGFADTQAIMKGTGRSAGLSAGHLLHAAVTAKPETLVSARMVREVAERIDSNGRVIVEVSEDDCREAVESLVANGCEAIAIAFLWSFLNEDHERRAEEIAREVAPGLPISRSSIVAPRLGEYERTMATVVNAYVAPSFSGYVEDLSEGMQHIGSCPPILFMQSNGGLATSDYVRGFPILTLQSGPVAGVANTNKLGSALKRSHIIATDMGGTTFDAAVIRDAELPVRDLMIVNQFRMFLPTIDIESIGAGGGSIIWADEISGTLRVGPESAGATPGPVVYGQGGTQPTITDADVVLGYIDANAFLGGRMTLAAEAAHSALGRIGEVLGLSAVEVAAGSKRIVDSKMADLIRKMTVERGYDPREFALAAYGGSGPTHAGGFARELGVSEVVIPFGGESAVWSAAGLYSADIRHIVETVVQQDIPLDVERLNAAYERIEGEGRDLLTAVEADKRLWRLERFAALHYKAQVHNVVVPVPGGTIDDAAAREIVDSFERKYAEIYGQEAAYREAGIELAMARVVASIARHEYGKTNGHGSASRSSGEQLKRRVFWSAANDYVETDVYHGALLTPGFSAVGPAVVDLENTTIVVEPGEQLRLEDHGSFVLTLPTPA